MKTLFNSRLILISMLILPVLLFEVPLTLHSQIFSKDTLKSQALTKNPHGEIAIACEACHTTTSWNVLKTSMDFDHNKDTYFELEGRHQAVSCRSCHSDLVFAGTKKQCVHCHQDLHRGRLGIQCGDCHRPSGWKPFDVIAMHAQTRFPLTGRHAVTSCGNCHKEKNQNEFTGVTTECSGCHLKEYLATSNPSHSANQFSLDCQSCHTPFSWKSSMGHEHARQGFPLTGGHSGVDCRSCHVAGYKNTSTACAACHLPDYNSAADPNHAASGFSTDCRMCHSLNPGWAPASFDHAGTNYQLTGAHQTIKNQCRSCHSGGFTNTPTNCYECHTDDYNNTTNPDHRSSNFSLLCETCHSQNAWKPSTFNHDAQYFPVYSGRHKNQWTGCGGGSGDGAGCHTVSSNYAVFSCLHCHEHRKSKMDDEHDDVSGYNYNSQACFSCHPDGNDRKMKFRNFKSY